MRFLLPLLLMLTAFNVGAAPRWVPVGQNEDAQVWIDTKTIRKMTDPKAMQVWAKVKYNKIRWTPDGLRYDTIERISVYNCEERTRRAVMEVFFFHGTVVDAKRTPEPESAIWPVLDDNTIGRAALKLVCK